MVHSIEIALDHDTKSFCIFTISMNSLMFYGYIGMSKNNHCVFSYIVKLIYAQDILLRTNSRWPPTLNRESPLHVHVNLHTSTLHQIHSQVADPELKILNICYSVIPYHNNTITCVRIICTCQQYYQVQSLEQLPHDGI